MRGPQSTATTIKRPPDGYFVFMREFKKEYNETFPENRSVITVAKAGALKWKAMSDSEKAPYVAEAATKKAKYVVGLKQFNYDLNENSKKKSASTSKSSSRTHNDVKEEAKCGVGSKQFNYDLKKEKSTSTPKSSCNTHDDVKKEANSN